jgi:quinolinate synthase
VVAYVNTPAAVKAEADICCTSANAVEVARRLGVPVLAHPECPEDVQGCADFVGSTSGMIQYLRKSRPRRVLLLTECSMADNVSIDLPDIEFLRPCNLCSYMKSITILGIAHTLEDGCHEIEVAPQIAVRARRAVQRMLDV